MPRPLLSPLIAIAVLFGTSIGTIQAQPRGQQRDDLLDALTRHIQICTELSDSSARLACFDRLQTRIGDVQSTNPPMASPQVSPPQMAGPQMAAPQPTPLQPGAPAPLGPPPTGYPNVQAGPAMLPPADPDRAFDPSRSTYRPPEAMAAKPQPAVRRTGPRPIPASGRPMPLVSLTADNLTYGDARYWQVSIGISSNTTRIVDVQVQCTFTNGGRPVEEVFFGPIPVQAGEQITTELVGPPTTAYIDSVNCKVLSP